MLVVQFRCAKCDEPVGGLAAEMVSAEAVVAIVKLLAPMPPRGVMRVLARWAGEEVLAAMGRVHAHDLVAHAIPAAAALN